MSKRVPFDEPALVKQLGMEYVYLPMRGTAEFPYSPAAVKSFADAMSAAKGKSSAALHDCLARQPSLGRVSHSVSWRARRDSARSGADDHLMDDMRMDGDTQPVESFLGHAVPEVRHPKQ